MFILKGVKALCFDTLLQVLILKVVKVPVVVRRQRVVGWEKRCWGADSMRNGSTEQEDCQEESFTYKVLVRTSC